MQNQEFMIYPNLSVLYDLEERIIDMSVRIPVADANAPSALGKV